jgi:hypothetical protein
MPRNDGRPLRTAVAVGGFALLAFVLLEVPWDGSPVPPWIVRFEVIWCVSVPYWQYLEYRLFLPVDAPPAERAHFEHLQRLSARVWLGAAIGLGVLILRGAMNPAMHPPG